MLTHLIIVSSLLLTPQTVFLPNAQAGCEPKLAAAGLCGSNGGDEVVIGGTDEIPGTPGDIGHPPTQPIGNDWRNPTAPAPTPTPIDQDFVDCLQDWDSYIRCFQNGEEDPDDDEPDDVVEIPSVTITDVARFAPQGSVVAGEPDNVGVAGLPTNFVATASEHTVEGELFGFPVAVRFSPSGYDFDYGDGSTLTAATGGQSWGALGLAQFTPTDTSHTYAERGTYAAHVNIRYTAAVDFGIGWYPITGEVTATGPAREIRIFEAHTALVAYTCAQNPSSPGC